MSSLKSSKLWSDLSWDSYSSTVWDPQSHTSININCLESVQRHAARICFRNYSRYSSVTSMLSELNLPTLQDRSRAKLQMMYKIIQHLVAIPVDCLNPAPSCLQTGYFNQLNTNVDSFKFSFSPSTIHAIMESTPRQQTWLTQTHTPNLVKN